MTEPICEWSWDEAGNLTIEVPAWNVQAFGNWINDECGDLEAEMYQLMQECDGRVPKSK